MSNICDYSEYFLVISFMEKNSWIEIKLEQSRLGYPDSFPM